MNDFPLEIVNELAERLDPAMREYFDTEKYLDDYGTFNFEELIHIILKEKLGSMDVDLKYIYERELMNRKKRRSDWAKKTQANVKNYPSSDPKSYFYSMRKEFRRNAKTYRERYHTTNIDEIIKQILNEINEWKTSAGRLVDFPNFPNVGSVNLVNIFKSDVFIGICDYVNSSHNGNMNDFNINTPMSLYENAIFSAEQGKVPISNPDNSGAQIVSMFLSEEYELNVDIINNTYGNKISVFDVKDRELLSYLINNVVFDIKNPTLLAQKQTASINAIARSLYKTSNPSTHLRRSVEQRLNKMTNPIFIVNKKMNTTYNWTLLSSVVIGNNEAGVREVSYVLGDVISDALIQNRVVKVSSVKYHELENAVSKSLYCILQLERLKLSLNGQQMIGQYTYSYFKHHLLLRTKQIKRNVEIIEQALQECIENSLVISSYTIKKNIFTINFIPLDDREKEQIVGNDGILSIDNNILDGTE